MERCDALVVGGGPAGATCARALRAGGLQVTVLDRAQFPRDKVCAGWVTPPVLRRLELDLEDYGQGRTLQPFTGFFVGTIGGKAVETRYPRPVSFGIRRSEFDEYLLRRSGARLRLGEPLRTLERRGEGWVANGDLEAPVVVGAGGHFCPVARLAGFKGEGETVIAQAAEVELTEDQARRCPVAPETPELYFSRDLQGYGWCLRKGRYLNVGLGRTGVPHLRQHLSNFLVFLRDRGRLPTGVLLPFRGHAYQLRPAKVSPSAADGILWVGDAAGLADPKSGEGIGPAVESGLLAAGRIFAAKGDYRKEVLNPPSAARHSGGTSLRIPLAAPLRAFVGRKLLSTHWFTKKVVLERWFLAPPPAS